MKRNGFGTGLMYVILVFLAVGLGIMIFLNFQANHQQMEELEKQAAEAATTPTPEPTATPEPTPTPNRTTETVSLAFAGDIVAQPGLTTDAAGDAEMNEAGEAVVSYDYFDEISGVLPSLNGSDFSACTFVGTMGSSGSYDEGYRMPASMATALAGVGFQLVNTASDHILDQGVTGLVDTVTNMSNEGLVVAGAYRSQQNHSVFMADVHGIHVAILSYTYGTGGVSIAEDPWCVDVFTTDYMTEQTTVDYDRIDSDIQAVRSAGADIVVCFLYWWDNTQYYTQPRAAQTEMAERLFTDGVDIIIGGGVKAPQPIEVTTVERADGTKANCVACYSLSNLMSCFNDKYTNLSATARIQISRDADTGETWVSGVSYQPLFMLDTDDYSDYEEPGFKYRLLDARDAVSNYENGGTDISAETYDALLTGIADLQDILGKEYDIANGGVTLDYPY